jgi:hypothetical protein
VGLECVVALVLQGDSIFGSHGGLVSCALSDRGMRALQCGSGAVDCLALMYLISKNSYIVLKQRADASGRWSGV